MKSKKVCSVLKKVGFGAVFVSTVATVICAVTVPASAILPVSIGLFAGVIASAGTMFYGYAREDYLNKKIYELSNEKGHNVQQSLESEKQQETNLENSQVKTDELAVQTEPTKISTKKALSNENKSKDQENQM